jgi:transcriptional regulator GlxA family with amidase domain
VPDLTLVAVPETAGSALYGLVDVLSASGSVWQSLVRSEPSVPAFAVRIVSPDGRPFHCGFGIPVAPAAAIAAVDRTDIVVLPELWLGPDQPLHGRYPALMAWIRRMHDQGAWLYSACSGAVMLAETGLLDGCDATSHWGYEDLFRTCYPKVKFRPEPSLAFADPAGRIVTAGGTTSWHDLAIHIIARHASPAEALRIAKVYLLKLHGEGQLPYRELVRGGTHGDAAVRGCEHYLQVHFRDHDALRRAVTGSGVPERSLKRRFKDATGKTLIEALQHLRIEEAKRLLEAGAMPVDEISVEVGYEDASFFRRVFKRLLGLTPAQYRRMFQPFLRKA